MKPVAFLAALVAAACALPLRDAPESLAAAERAFAAQSVRDGMRQAFIAHFAEDGVMVRSGWVNARAALAGQPQAPFALDWRPVFVETAASGELGVSTGPWRASAPGEAAAHGQFVSVWRRGELGAWEVAVDLGISHDGAALWDAPLAAATVSATGGAPGEGIDAAEARFERDAARLGTPAAYAANAAATLRWYRNGAPPQIRQIRGRTPNSANSESVPELPSLAWRVERVEAARSADLGYARGTYASAADPAHALGCFLRVWRREDGRWRIALDVMAPTARR
jgi:ketosteroid isomerase-like protein